MSIDEIIKSNASASPDLTCDPDITLNSDAPVSPAPAISLESEPVPSEDVSETKVCPVCGAGFDTCYCAVKSLGKWLAVSALCFGMVVLAHAVTTVTVVDSETRLLLISFVLGIAAGPAMASLMYFHFRMRLKAWQMRAAAVLIFCLVWTGVFFVMVLLVIEALDSLSSVDKWMLTWMFPTAEVILAAVLSYAGAFLGSYSLVFVDRWRSAVLDLFEDPPMRSSLSDWARGVSPFRLVALPILFFTIATVVANRASSFLVHSEVQIDRQVSCPGCPTSTGMNPVKCEIIHPFYFQSNKVDVVRLSTTGIDQGRTPSCTLDAPSFEVRPIPLDAVGKEFQSDGVSQAVPTCLWLVMPRHSGDQKAVLRLSFPSAKTQGTEPGSQVLQGNLVELVTFHVSPPLFTFSNLAVIIALVAITVGIARIIGRGVSVPLR